MGASGTEESFWSALRAAVRPRDCLALASVPLVVAGLFAGLTTADRRELAFEYADPSLVTAFTAHYVHIEFEHFVANLFGFVLLAGAAYVLAVLAGRRGLFGVAAVTYLGAFPFVLSGLNLAMTRRAVGYGLSGVNMAFAGLLGLMLVAYARERVDDRVRMRYAPAVFFLAAGAVSLLAIPVGPLALGIAAACVLAATAYVVTAWRTVVGQSAGPGSACVPHAGAGSSGRWFDVGVLGAAVLAGGLYVAFPEPGSADEVVVNLYVHLLGFCLGFLVPYVTVELGAFDPAGPGRER